MQKRLVLTNLMIVALVILAAGKADALTASVDMPAPTGMQLEAVDQDGSSVREPLKQVATNDLICADPAPAVEQTCGALERQILASVVRLEVRGPDVNNDGHWAGGKGHATIMDGRYLVTHNHFSTPLSMLKNLPNNGAAAVSMYKANGEKIMLEAPPTVFTVVVKDPETLVLDFGTNGAGQGFFEALGIPSAKFKAWQDLELQQGTEVAQIGWDGATAHVNWVRVNDFSIKDGTPTLELDSIVTLGASGGGVFWQGYHIANNWAVVSVLNQAGSVVRQYCMAALNSAQVVAPAAQPTLAGTPPTAAQVEKGAGDQPGNHG
ncbi:MAG: hypothetical protein KAS38_07795 [Anaerolineales bacterium]|nr:hypothetical protein [Anaerolineales bacterium]MCK4975537.1 hypothetical protein [Anaerolineales bacterium]